MAGDPRQGARPARRPAGRAASCVGIPAALLLAGCNREQSALAPAGRGAEAIFDLTVWMTVGGVLIWLAVMAVALYAVLVRREAHERNAVRLFVVLGGVVFPVPVLAVLLVYGLALLPELRAAGDGLTIDVSGEQWWWRVGYRADEASEPIASANEIRLPVGERVELVLTSPDVIHSLWIPALAGKVDMIPGRTTRLVVEATKTGEFRGACAEFCGTSHALMAFRVVVMEPAAFRDWLDHIARPAAPAEGTGPARFLAAGCGGCHTVRGTAAAGTIGPDLTHVGGRRSLGAGILPNTHDGFVRWIAETHAVKPDVRMPSFGMLPEADLDVIARFLEGLE